VKEKKLLGLSLSSSLIPFCKQSCRGAAPFGPFMTERERKRELI
jgi:hypothetical protein